MATTTLHHTNHGHSVSVPFVTNFINWCNAQEYNRLLWVGLGLGIHGCILTPITVLTVLIFGASLGMVGITAAILAMTAVLIVNLAALPTKVTIPTFAISILVDIVLIAAALL